jgi:branched-chain amino acid transport system permease protein
MNSVLTAVFSGTSQGAVYALVSLGLVLVWRGAGVVNFAQMGQAMFTTYIASQLIQNNYSYWSAFVIALVAGAVLGAIVDLALMRPLTSRKNSQLLNSQSMRTTIPVIASLGILGVLKALAGIFWAGEERGFPAPVPTTGLRLGNTDLAITGFDLFVIGVVFLTLVITTIFFTRTGMGLAMRASALNPEVTRLSGIRVGSVRTLSWAISGTASSLAGLLVTPKTNLSPNTLDLLLIVGFTAAVVGGLTSLAGSVLGGFIVGYVIAFVNVYSAPENVFLAILIFLLLALFLRPQGILGSKEVRRV